MKDTGQGISWNYWKYAGKILDGRTDGEYSQQKAAAFPDNQQGSLFLENCV